MSGTQSESAAGSGVVRDPGTHGESIAMCFSGGKDSSLALWAIHRKRAYTVKTLLSDLPPGVDPCGENGEFHTFVFDGPIFQRSVSASPGEVVERGDFAFSDLLPGRRSAEGRLRAQDRRGDE